MSSRANGQLNLPPTLLTNHSQDEPLRTNCSHEPEALSAQLVDEAITEARLTSQEVAHLTGVSESLVNRWRSANYRECPSFTQLLRLPPAFHFELHRAMNRRFGFGRLLLRRLLDDVADLALVTEA